jgi:hypothetical protein
VRGGREGVRRKKEREEALCLMMGHYYFYTRSVGRSVYDREGRKE